MITISELKSGLIFGDNESGEYVYMPASEIGIDNPMCVYEINGQRSDVDLQEALRLIRVRASAANEASSIGNQLLLNCNCLR